MPLLPHADPLLILAVVLLFGVGFGTLAKRMGLPSITGQILAGVLIGQAGFDSVPNRKPEVISLLGRDP